MAQNNSNPKWMDTAARWLPVVLAIIRLVIDLHKHSVG